MKNQKKRRLGFTLVELLLVIAILGVLGMVVVVNFGGFGEKGAITATQQSIAAIDQAVEFYKGGITTTPPKSLDDLTQPQKNGEEALLKASQLKDAWGNPFEYSVSGKKHTIRSAGPDGQMGTDDDLTN